MSDRSSDYAPDGLLIKHFPPDRKAAYAQECVSSYFPVKKAQERHSWLRSGGYITCTHCGVRFMDVTWGEDP